MDKKTSKQLDPQIIQTEIPSSLKQLARLVVRGFYSPEDALIIDMLVRYPCLREDDLSNLLKFDKKMLRAKVAGLRNDKFLLAKPRMETTEDNKVIGRLDIKEDKKTYFNFRLFSRL